MSPFLVVIMSTLSPFCFPVYPVLSLFLLVVGPFGFPSVSCCLHFCWSWCPSCLSSVSFLLPSCFSSCWSLCPPCFSSVSFRLCPFCLLVFLFVSLLVSVLVCYCVRLVSLLVDVSKSGLGNASLLSNLFGVYGGVMFFRCSCSC